VVGHLAKDEKEAFKKVKFEEGFKKIFKEKSTLEFTKVKYSEDKTGRSF